MKNLSVFALLMGMTFSCTAQKTKTLTFPKGKVIEVALIGYRDGKQPIVQQEYFPKVFPVAQEYGLLDAQTFSVVETHYGDAPVQQFGFFIWDSYEQKEKFDKDPRYLELRNIRNKAFNFLYMGYFQVESDVTYTFDNESIYDFAAMFIDVANAPKLQQYFEKVAPVAMTDKYGYQPIVTLNPLNECTKGKYVPDIIGFAKWSVSDGFSKLKKNSTYKKYVHLRDAATPYKDVFMVKANIQ
ncbi:MAG: hypothetical protein AAF039_15225 [Bacteroidota bacterium]